jgi:hypothetical protein
MLAAVIMFMAACAGNAPSSLTPAGVKDWQANEVVVAIGTLQRTAIALNGVQVCDPAPCHALFSDANTRTVIDAVEVALKTIQAAPAGWRVAADTALTQITTKVDAAGLAKLQPYLAAARSVIDSLKEVK